VTGRRIHRLFACALALSGGGCAVAALAIPVSAPAAPNPALRSAPDAASAAAAATIHLNQPCYQVAQQAALSGTGFDPSARWAATLDGSAFGSGKTNTKGGITAKFGVPSRLRAGSTGEDSYQLVVRERRHSADATFLVTRLSAGFSPTSGDLSTLKVRFRLLGWGRKGSLYLHYLSPNGAVRLDRSLGPVGGACGHLTTSPLKLFPFRPKVGVWTLQFSKDSAYKADSRPRVVYRYRVG
jgi:hypothetical protein